MRGHRSPRGGFAPHRRVAVYPETDSNDSDGTLSRSAPSSRVDVLMNRQQPTSGALLVPLILALVFASATSPHGTRGQQSSIVGRVVGGGQPLPGAAVTAMRRDGGTTYETTSGSGGEYRFDNLATGTYRLDFDVMNFDLVRRNNVQVRQDATSQVDDVALSPSAICECITAVHGRDLRERAGQVLTESGHPLAHARLEVVSRVGREVAYADREGRFRLRVSARQTWQLTAADTGFRNATQLVSGTASSPIIFRLSSTDTAPPDTERFKRSCRCPGDSFSHPGR